jgi:hypothetical protein
MPVENLNFRGMMEYLAREEGVARRPNWSVGAVIIAASQYRPTIDDMLAEDWVYERTGPAGGPELFICWHEPVCGQAGNSTDDPKLVTCPECREHVENGGHRPPPTQLEKLWAILQGVKEPTHRAAAIIKALGDDQSLLWARVFAILHDEWGPAMPAPCLVTLDGKRVFWDKGEFCTTRQLLTTTTRGAHFYWHHGNRDWTPGTGDKVRDAMTALDTFPGFRKTWD